MTKCMKCGVYITDNTDKCPLCQQVVAPVEQPSDNGTRYPDVKGASRKYRLLENIILFLSIVGQIVLTTVDYMTDREINWSFIVLLVVIYANVTLRLAIVGRNGYIFKIVSTFVFTVLFLEGIDLLTGASGWALTFVFPSAILAMVPLAVWLRTYSECLHFLLQTPRHIHFLPAQ